MKNMLVNENPLGKKTIKLLHVVSDYFDMEGSYEMDILTDKGKMCHLSITETEFGL